MDQTQERYTKFVQLLLIFAIKYGIFKFEPLEIIKSFRYQHLRGVITKYKNGNEVEYTKNITEPRTKYQVSYLFNLKRYIGNYEHLIYCLFKLNNTTSKEEETQINFLLENKRLFEKKIQQDALEIITELNNGFFEVFRIHYNTSKRLITMFLCEDQIHPHEEDKLHKDIFDKKCYVECIPTKL